MLLAVCLLLAFLHPFASSDKMAFSSAPDAREEYSNVWAVEVPGGRSAADDLAQKHGFTNKGQVRS